MRELLAALSLGFASAFMLWLALRSSLAPLAWVALMPLAWCTFHCPPRLVLLSAAATGVLSMTPVLMDRTQRHLVVLVASVSSLTWGTAYGCTAALCQRAATPWLCAALFPLAAVLALVPLRLAGAPRWVSNPIARTQEPLLRVVHIAQLGGDLLVTANLAAVSGGMALLLPPASASSVLAALVSLGLAGVLLAYGSYRFAMARRAVDTATRVRMAAVAVDVPPPEHGPLTGWWSSQSPHARDVLHALARYNAPIQRAASEGAELVLLPECAVFVDATSRAVWLNTLAVWAQRAQVAIIAPYFDVSAPSNELAVIDACGILVGTYQKQHPGRGIEPKRSARTHPGPYLVCTRARTLPLSTVICVDADYADLVATARRVGGVLNVPANDWPLFEQMHHRTAVWAAAMSGVPILRSTGHGTSSIYDGAGRVLAAQSSLDGPVVLVADVPLAQSQL